MEPAIKKIIDLAGQHGPFGLVLIAIVFVTVKIAPVISKAVVDDRKDQRIHKEELEKIDIWRKGRGTNPPQRDEDLPRPGRSS
jgi:hypothetical protein